jgi:hypothetical protein
LLTTAPHATYNGTVASAAANNGTSAAAAAAAANAPATAPAAAAAAAAADASLVCRHAPWILVESVDAGLEMLVTPRLLAAVPLQRWGCAS